MSQLTNNACVGYEEMLCSNDFASRNQEEHKNK